jgi:hypothetical protein
MKNYKIDTTLLPEVWLTWMSQRGRIWMNDKGERYNKPQSWMRYDSERSMNSRWANDSRIPFGSTYSTRNSDRIWIAAGSQFHYAYVKYHADIDRLEVAAVKYDTTRGEGKHAWSYAGDRLFIGKDKSVIDQNGKGRCETYNIKKHSIAFSVREALQMIFRLTCSDKVTDEFKKFIGHNYFIIGNGTSVNIEYPWHLNKWYDSVQKTRSSGKTQKLVDELTKMPLGSIDGLECKYTPKRKKSYGYYEHEYTNNIIYFEKVNDEWSVLRALVREENGLFDEVWRIYLGEDGTSRIVAKSNDEWIPASQQRDYYCNKSYYFANEQEAKEKCNRIKYIAPILSETDGITTLITTLRFPSIEQLYKMGRTKMAKAIAHSSTPKAELKTMFGDYYKEKEKGILRQIGMTKHQLEKYDNICQANNDGYFSWRGDLLRRMRELFGDDLSHIDNTTYDKYIEAFSVMMRDFWGIRYLDNSINVDRGRFWKNLIRLAEKNNNAYRVMNDTLSVHKRLNAPRPEIDWLFDDYSDMVRTHDALTELANEQDRQYRAYLNASEAERRRQDDEKRKKVDEKRKHYEYEDDEFIIRLPKDVNEIVTEGSRQSICIGGYTTRHSRGDTNLFFLRRKDDEATPFYAIEMNNDKQIVQIHGSCNKWLGNNPEAIPTVVRWLRKHDIKCDQQILTCTAKGYGRTNEYIAMPVVD